jgi:drug/metabolite transporter (DMT)-like permease
LGLRVFFKEIPPPTERIGVLYVAIGVLALAATNTIARKLATAGSNASTLMISTVGLWAGGFPVVLAGLAFDCPPAVTGWRNWSIIVLNAVVSISVGTAVWILILRSLRSYEASILGATSVIYTALFAVPILGERLALHQVAGIACMLLGVALVQFRRPTWRRRSERNTEAA